MVDPVEFTQKLIHCPSVTPADEGAIALVEATLTKAGFKCQRIRRGGIENLFARWGTGRTIGFNGHTDVVPTGDPEGWSDPPFSGVIRDGQIYGRGACDMKSGVAAFVAAAVKTVTRAPPDGSIVLAITGDEEGDAIDGTAAILDWMQVNGETMDACLVGEPTSREEMGDMIKIGRRGSMTAYVTATGRQGHSAYPHRARNPLPVLVALLDDLARETLDEGTEHFDPSTLALTTIDTGNPANNVIPGEARATLNIRFNDAHSSASLISKIDDLCAKISGGTGVTLAAEYRVSGESFITPPGPLSDLVVASVEKVTGRRPVLSTSGGTSDARFVRSHCPVVECGLVGGTMHQTDERVDIGEIRQLTEIYELVIAGFFADAR